MTRKYLTYLKSPYAIVASTVAGGLLLNSYLAAFLLSPVLTEQAQLNSQLDSLNQQQTMLQARPIPAKVTDEEKLTLLEQVPTTEEWVRFYLQLRDIERSSGAVMEQIRSGTDGSDTSSLSALNEALKSSPGSAQSGNPSAGAGNGANAPMGSGIALEAHKVTLSLVGTYKQSVDFVNGLYQLNRLVALNNWTLSSGISEQGGSTTSVASTQSMPNTKATREKVRLTLDLTVYSAGAYKDKLKELPPLQPVPVDKRMDPTWSEEHYRALLETLKP